MKRNLFRKAMCLLLSVTMLFGALGVTAFAARLKDDSSHTSLDEMKSFLNASSYAAYKERYKDSAGSGLSRIDIDVVAALVRGEIKPGESYAGIVTKDSICYNEAQSEANRALWEQFGDNWENTVYLPAKGTAEWQFDIPDGAEGLYYIAFEYYTCDTADSSISSVERKLYIDGAIPFSEASYLTFPKSWKYSYVSNPVVTDTDEADDYRITYELRNRSDKLEENGYFKIVTEIKSGKKTVTEYRIAQDINGNSMSPELVQNPQWGTYYCQDSTGYYNEYFAFHFQNAKHTLRLEAQREPMIIKSISLVPVGSSERKIESYKDVRAEYENRGYTSPQNGKITVLQAEFPDLVSDNSVTAGNNNSSSATYPSASSAQLFNVIGKNSYNAIGQWAAYDFKVNESGLYTISMRYLQSALQGMYICRAVKLFGGHTGTPGEGVADGVYGLSDGTPEVPFAEAYNTQFDYSKEWQSNYISDGSGDAFQFYFKAGTTYTLYLECSLGSLKELIQRVEISMDKVNNCYLRILQLTGADPDEFRSYSFDKIMPEVLIELLDQAIELDAVSKAFEELCGTKGSHIATLDTVAILLDRMGRDEGVEIAANMSNLKSYLGTLGTWINNSKKSTLILDEIEIHPASDGQKELPRANAGFFSAFWFEIKSFFGSFFTDYDAMGLTTRPTEDTKTIEVWLATGRDQSQIWRTMIDASDGYTEATGTAVTLKLVTGGTLLPSILAGKGPDVYLGLDAASVINYAIRDAVIGVSGNDKHLTEEQNRIFTNTYYTYKDENGQHTTVTSPIAGREAELSYTTHPFDEAVKKYDFETGDGKFVEAALNTIRLLGVTYGVPQTMSFAMMFYRTDILAKLGEEIPETWPQVLALLPVLQANNMSIGLSYASAIDFLLYQMGGNMWRYTDNEQYAGARIGLNTDIALTAFDYVCRLYSDYSFPVNYDGANRFRTGEMPIIVGDYAGIYNQLVVYATEIDGLWEFGSLPGWVRDNGEFNYDSLAGVGATVMLHGCQNMLEAWQFVQWETSGKVQADYGNRMVALIGPSAKYESANVTALNDLSWTAKEKAAIADQMKHLSSVVNYPGSYIIGRYTKFAFLNTVNNGADAVDAMNEYIDAINAELKRKRKEFDLPTLDSDVDESELPGA